MPDVAVSSAQDEDDQVDKPCGGEHGKQYDGMVGPAGNDGDYGADDGTLDGEVHEDVDTGPKVALLAGRASHLPVGAVEHVGQLPADEPDQPRCPQTVGVVSMRDHDDAGHHGKHEVGEG